MAPSQPSLKARALRALAQREHSRAELARKLARHVQVAGDGAGESGDGGGAAPEELDAVLDQLAARGLLSDARAAEAWVAAKAGKAGSRQLRHALSARGIGPELIERALAQVPQSEYERARALWQRKFGAAAVDAAGRARQARFLMARGFDADTVRQVLRAATRASPEAHATDTDSPDP